MIVSVGGNIGCGKSTLLKNLSENVFLEPVEKWGSWLDMFYSNMQRYGFGFQMKVLLEFLGISLDRVITERSPLDALYVFGANMLTNGFMTGSEYVLFKDYVNRIGWKPDVYVYLRADPAVCYERIQRRSRDAEKHVPFDYIVQIHNMYENFVEKMDPSIQVFVVDANQHPDVVQAALQKILSDVNY